PGTLTLNSSYDGGATSEILQTSGTLASGDTAQIRLIATVSTLTDSGFGFGVYESQSTIMGESANFGLPTFDFSDEGTNPDPNDNGNPYEPGENDPSSFSLASTITGLGVALNATVDGPVVTFDYTLANLGNNELTNISVPHDLDAVFGSGNYSLIEGPFFVGFQRNLTLNTQFDGSSNMELIGGGTLPKRTTETIRLAVRIVSVVDQGGGLGLYTAQVVANGSGPFGGVMDTSDSGTNPDGDGDGNAGGSDEDDNTEIALPDEIASISGVVWNDLNGDGVRDSGEPGIDGVRVFLDTNTDGIFDSGEASELSDLDGNIQFTDLASGNYTIEIDETTVPQNFVLTTNAPVEEVLVLGEMFEGANFGLFEPAIPDLTGLGRPDLRVGERASPTRHRGDNVYGVRQVLRTTTSKRKVNVYLSLENDGTAADQMVTRGRGSIRNRFRLRIRARGSGNVTAAFRRGRTISSLGVGEITSFRINIGNKSPDQNRTFRFRVETRSATGSAQDRAGFQVRFRQVREQGRPGQSDFFGKL
ncbi:MAG: SdrD B-like domain-containing protein, partial [Verrucomicrobiota bacterium]